MGVAFDVSRIAELMATERYPTEVLEETISIYMENYEASAWGRELDEDRVGAFLRMLEPRYPALLQECTSFGSVSVGACSTRVLEGAVAALRTQDPSRARAAADAILEAAQWPITDPDDAPRVLDLVADPNGDACCWSSLLPFGKDQFLQLCYWWKIPSAEVAKRLVAWLVDGDEHAFIFLRQGATEQGPGESGYAGAKWYDRVEITTFPWHVRKRVYELIRPKGMSLEDEIVWLMERENLWSTGAMVLAEEHGLESPYRPENWCLCHSAPAHHVHRAEPLLWLAHQLGDRGLDVLEKLLKTMVESPWCPNSELFLAVERAIGLDEYGEVAKGDTILMMGRLGRLVVKWSGKLGKKGRFSAKAHATEDKARKNLHAALETKSRQWGLPVRYNERTPLENPEGYLDLLDRAVSWSERGLVRELLSRGVPWDATDAPDYPWMAASRDPVVLRFFLDAGADVNRLLPEAVSGSTLSDCMVPVVRLLLDAGADPTAVRFDNGRTILHFAAEQMLTNVEVVRLLVDAGADPLQADDDGVLPVDIARRRLKEDIVAYLESVVGQRQAGG